MTGSATAGRPIRWVVGTILVVLLTLGWMAAVWAIAPPWLEAVLGQWATSYDAGSPERSAEYERISHEAQIWDLRLALALVAGPAVTALLALLMRLKGVALAYAIVTALAAIPAGMLALYGGHPSY